jgi:glucose/arabinose dehydrogenase
VRDGTAAARTITAALTLLLTACGKPARLPDAATHGPHPTLPPAEHAWIPAIVVAPAVGWTAGAAPTAASGLEVRRFADNLVHPRWLYVLPNGDVLVAETNGPSRPDDAKGVKGWVARRLLAQAGAGMPSPDRITLLRDADRDGHAEFRSVLLERLYSPFGMTLVGDELYVANSDALMRYRYVEGDTQIETAGVRVVELPAGSLNHHWTKNVLASEDGTKLYVTVGSNSNTAENGIGVERDRAAIWEIDRATGARRLFATGLRNPNGLDLEPTTGSLWTVVNERDEIGSDLVPDYLTSVRDGGFYGWPFSYYGAHVDERVQPQRPDLVASAIVPDYALGNHTGSLGLVFARGADWPPEFQTGAFIGQHGSWNRSPFSGYKVIFIPFRDGAPAGPPRDVLTGFLDTDGRAQGRPVGLAFDRTGALLVADDVGNVVWAVLPSPVSR